MGIPVKMKNVVICYPHLYEKHAAPGTTNAKYSAEFILDPVRNREELASLEQAFKQAATEAGKGDQLQFLDPPYKEGAAVNRERQRKGKAPRPELEGKWLIRASSGTDQPGVANKYGQPISESNSGQIFSGCVVYGFIDLYFSNNSTNPGVFAGLNGVQLVDNQNVEPIATTRSQIVFEPIEGAPEPIAPAPTPESWM